MINVWCDGILVMNIYSEAYLNTLIDQCIAREGTTITENPNLTIIIYKNTIIELEMNNLFRYRAITKDLIRGEKVIYFDACLDANGKTINGFENKHFRGKKTLVNQSSVQRFDRYTGFKDIYENDVLEVPEMYGNRSEYSHYTVFLDHGAFLVDVSPSQERTKVEPLSTFLRRTNNNYQIVKHI